MDEQKPDHLKTVPPSLKAALRRARVDSAEQSHAVADLRETEIARLEMLEDAIRPVLAQVPHEVDIFDPGIAYGERPRLFIDMIGFVEMAHDRRAYRFQQDTRHGRAVLAESERVERMVEAIADYIAQAATGRARARVGLGIGAAARRARPSPLRLNRQTTMQSWRRQQWRPTRTPGAAGWAIFSGPSS